MSITRSARLFKFMVVASIAVIFFVFATRQSISKTVNVYREDNKSFFEQLKYNLAKANPHQNSEEERQLDSPDSNPEQISNNDENRQTEEELIITETEEPFDDGMPGAHLRYYAPAPDGLSYCKFNYGLPYVLNYTKKYYYPPQQGRQSQYRIVYNVTEAFDIDKTVNITFATHMTANYAYFIPELLKRWDGLITVAAFVPDLDVAFFLEQITQYCYCDPEMHRASIHIVTLKPLPFSKKDVSFDRPDSCTPKDSSKIMIFSDFDETVTYPINVVRNVARTSALSKYILLADCELMPSRGLAQDFLKFVKKFNSTISPREVFPLPIFEVEEDQLVPETKPELLTLMSKNKSVYFHALVCQHCQKFPGLDKWTKTNEFIDIKPFMTVKRHKKYHRWEPVFIGTNKEPLYTEQLTWEGFQDKMTQSLEMCLQNYNYTILDNAFLCHWPGIKRSKASQEEWRFPYIEDNVAVYAKEVKKMLDFYTDIPECEAKAVIDIVPKKHKTKT